MSRVGARNTQYEILAREQARTLTHQTDIVMDVNYQVRCSERILPPACRVSAALGSSPSPRRALMRTAALVPTTNRHARYVTIAYAVMGVDIDDTTSVALPQLGVEYKAISYPNFHWLAGPPSYDILLTARHPCGCE